MPASYKYGFQNSAEYVELRERVHATSNEITGIRQSLEAMGQRFETSLNAIVAKFDTSISALNTKFEDRNKTPWAVIISGLAFIVMLLTAIGSIAYVPIQQGLAEVKHNVWLQSQNNDGINRRQWDTIVTLRAELDRMRGYAEGQRAMREHLRDMGYLTTRAPLAVEPVSPVAPSQ